MVNSIDEYELYYNLFISESDMYKKLTDINMSIVLYESVDIVSIEEGVKDTIMNYITKVTQGLQKAWNTFSDKLSGYIQGFLNKNVKPVIEKNNTTEFIINNYRDYDINALTSIRIDNFDYNDSTKHIYESESSYFKNKYPYLNIEGSDVKTALENKYVRVVDKQVANKEFISKIYNFCVNGYKNTITSLKDKIEVINNSNKLITSQVSTVVSAQEAYTIYENMNILFEAEDDKSEKMSFTDTSSGETSDNNSDKNRNSLIKAVTVYMKAATKIISSIMSMITKFFKDSCLAVLKHVVSSVTNLVKKKNNEATPTTAPTVKTN
jgi:hypothetical protein